MKDDKSLLGKVVTGVSVALLIASVLDIVTSSLAGVFLFLWAFYSIFLSGMGAWLLNATAWYILGIEDFIASDQWWLWIPSILIAAVMAARTCSKAQSVK